MTARRTLLNKLTKKQLVALGKKYGIVLKMSDTKIGMGSSLMQGMTATQIKKELE